MAAFHSTLWSEVLRAKDADPSALEALASRYWPAVYVFLRRKGISRDLAEDRTQGFFAHFLEKGLLDRVDPARGRFRNYLLAVLENWLANLRRVESAEKRGGGRAPLAFDFERAETDLLFEPADGTKPEDAFRRAWALSVLEGAFAAMREDFARRGETGRFDVVRDYLRAAGERPSYRGLAQKLSTSVSDVTNLLHRCRKFLRERIRRELADTVESEEAVDSEVRDLFGSFGAA